ncbi:hypothetical protein VIBC2010_18614 [Vibrio caribbeanicus ATCC BAA-2122]|uniref:Uncharacterized protein n=1 Tax=Vibrio caribbeanicus ATCC BAA-2122 TaxID=796620 RepID=E3BHZ3_9VIBR|nr:hypothetical protein VIBC2010_18614 [Vibrio caribbeanicus ATCC BAA-2122]
MTKQDTKKVALTVVGTVLAAYTVKFLKQQGWL